MVKNSPANVGDLSSVPEWGRSPGEGNGNPLQYSCLIQARGILKRIQQNSGQRSLVGYSPWGRKELDMAEWLILSLNYMDKVMSLLFNMLSRFVIAFLWGSKHLLKISWLQLPSAVILEPKKIKSVTISIVSPSVCHEVVGPDAMILVFWMLSFKPALSLFHFQQEAL